MNERELIDQVWPALDPPAEFSARVIGALAQPAGRPQPPPKRLKFALWPLVAAAAGGALCAAVFMRAGQERQQAEPSTGGEVTASVRRTINLASRGTAVAEAGAELAWVRAGEALRVEHRRGAVFYRVDRGGPFVVSTTAGEVQVTGTCFRVDLDSEAGAMLVHVFEGSVRLRNALGELALPAGERGRVVTGRAPAAATATASPAERRAEAAEARVQQLERALTEARGLRHAPGPPPDKAFDLTPDERRALAERCEFRYAMPHHLATLEVPELDDRFGLNEYQRRAVVRVMEEHRNEYLEALRAIYLEVVGDRAAASTLSPIALQNEISIKSRKGEDQEARRHIFREWTGRAPPVKDLTSRPPVERFWRLASSAGDTFLARLTAVVGAERAREMSGRMIKSIVRITDGGRCLGGP